MYAATNTQTLRTVHREETGTPRVHFYTDKEVRDAAGYAQSARSDWGIQRVGTHSYALLRTLTRAPLSNSHALLGIYFWHVQYTADAILDRTVILGTGRVQENTVSLILSTPRRRSFIIVCLAIINLWFFREILNVTRECVYRFRCDTFIFRVNRALLLYIGTFRLED